MLTLSVDKRDEKGPSAQRLRHSGKIPGVVYGAHQASTSISVDGRAFEKIFREAGENSIVALSGIGAEIPTLIHEVDLDPLTHRPRHIDFYAVTKGEKIEVAIPLNFIGESPAVTAGANLVKVLYELEIKADPMNLPHSITVDLAMLVQVGAQIHANDLVLPDGVELVTDADDVIALTQEVVEEKEEVVPADISAIEVEKKGKEESEADAGSTDEKAAVQGQKETK